MPIETAATLDTLRRALHGLRGRTPASSFSTREAALSDIRTGYVDNVPVKRLVITLRSPGCEWVRREGGCIMCGHHAGTTRGIVPTADDFVAQLISELERYSLDNIEVISIYNSGSALNPAELPPAAFEDILHRISMITQVRKVVVESRSEYIDPAVVAHYAGILGKNRRLSIAIGLESADDVLRDLCLNKGTTLSEIGDSVRSLKGIAETQLYVFLGIPFLTEREMFDDAVTSLRCASDLGADEIHIEPATIQEHTLLKELALRGLYRLPSLYTLYEVLKTVLPDIRPYVSPFMHMPRPERIPEGCHQCSGGLIDGLLERYNIDQSRESLTYDYCDCQTQWRARMEEVDPRPLTERIACALDILSDSTV